MIRVATIYLAGFLTIFSPCVLPMLPIIFKGSLGGSHKKLALMLSGLVTSYSIIGWSFAYFGSIFELNENDFRVIAGVTFILLGLWLSLSFIKQKMSSRLSSMTSFFNDYSHRVDTSHNLGAFLLGTLFGIVWTPCTGPTLAFAITLASTQSSLLYSFILMVIFGLGTVTPIFMISYGFSKYFNRFNNQHSIEKINKWFGVMMIALGILLLTGVDRALQSWMITVSPDWLIDLSTLL